MTIRKGQDWGQRLPRRSELLTFDDDASADRYLTQQIQNGLPVMPISIIRSNLGRTLGVKSADTSNQMMLCTVFDAVEVSFISDSGQSEVAHYLGHAIIRNSWWRGSVIGVFNSSFINNRDWAPRAHPNDSKIDIITVDRSMSLRQRLKANQLLKSGAHLPHPKIDYRQATQYRPEGLEPADLYLDGMCKKRVTACEFRVIPDAASLYW